MKACEHYSGEQRQGHSLDRNTILFFHTNNKLPVASQVVYLEKVTKFFLTKKDLKFVILPTFMETFFNFISLYCQWLFLISLLVNYLTKTGLKR